MPTHHDVVISFAESVIAQADFAQIETLYQPELLKCILDILLDYLSTCDFSIVLVNFLQKPCELEIYVTDSVEARAINFDARGKDYATNILSYPSELPKSVLEILPVVPLGELIVCHEVVIKQAQEQGKSLQDHLTYLVVHGILHLLGFDHELGQVEQDEMESIEIAVLSRLNIANPYE